MALIHSSLEDITPDVKLSTSKPKISGNDTKLLANDSAMDTRIVDLESKVIGCLYIKDNATSIALAVQNTWYKITTNWVEKSNVSNNAGYVVANGEMFPTKAGARTYKVEANISYSGDSSDTFEISLFRYDSIELTEYELLGTKIERKLGVSGDVGAISLGSPLSLDSNDILYLKARCTNGANSNITITNANFNIIEV